jgi:small neutral amino acid transporter SnatA (MarC family)
MSAPHIVIPEPTQVPHHQRRKDRGALLLLGLFVTLGSLSLAMCVLWAIVQVVLGIWHHPVGGFMVCGGLAVFAYAWHTIRHGDAL